MSFASRLHTRMTSSEALSQMRMAFTPRRATGLENTATTVSKIKEISSRRL